MVITWGLIACSACSSNGERHVVRAEATVDMATSECFPRPGSYSFLQIKMGCCMLCDVMLHIMSEPGPIMLYVLLTSAIHFSTIKQSIVYYLYYTILYHIM